MAIPTTTWGAALKFAGTSDARQERQMIPFMNLLDADQYPVCNLLGGEYLIRTDGQTPKNKVVPPVIPSVALKTLTPEVPYFEVAPTEFRLTADTAAIDVGDTATLTLDSNAGLSVGDIIDKIDQNAQARVTSQTGTTQVGITVIYSAGGSVAWTASGSVKYIRKLSNAQPDAPTAGNGTNQEPVISSFNLQFGMVTLAEGILQEKLALYNSDQAGGSGISQEFMNEKKRKGNDVMRQREYQMCFGRATSTGTGASRILTHAGFRGLAGQAFNNPLPGGQITYDLIARTLAPALRQGGGGREVYMLCGNDTLASISAILNDKKRVTDNTTEYRSHILTFEVSGVLLRLVPSQLFNTPAMAGHAIAFQPKFLKRGYLRELDMEFRNDLSNGSEILKRAGYLWTDSLLTDNLNSITYCTGLLSA